jgi:hypothetical protein
MAANMDQPCPADRISYRRDLQMRVSCPCGHSLTFVVGELAARYGLPGSMELWRMLDRLKCSHCGNKELRVRV